VPRLGGDSYHRTIETYDRNAADYAARVWDIVLTRALDSFTSYLSPGALVLDLGCGPGRDLELLQQRGVRALGIDLSLGMLREARRRVGGALAQADMCRLPLAGDCLNGVWFCAALLHLPRERAPQAIGEVHRALRPGGVVYISVRRGSGQAWRDEYGTRFFSYYQPDELNELMAKGGFETLACWMGAGQPKPWINLIGRAK
jgi:SAM-dependent methyltransferase